MGERAGAAKEAAGRGRWCAEGEAGGGGQEAPWEGVWARAAPLPSMLCLDPARPTLAPRSEAFRAGAGAGSGAPLGWTDVIRRGLKERTAREDAAGGGRPSGKDGDQARGEGRDGGRKTWEGKVGAAEGGKTWGSAGRKDGEEEGAAVER